MDISQVLLLTIWAICSLSFIIWKYLNDGRVTLDCIFIAVFAGPFLIVGLLPFGGWGAGNGV